jgi:ribonuclease J
MPAEETPRPGEAAPGTLRVIPLGGLGEIGKNMLVLEYGDDIVVIDAGVMFPEEDMPGVDLVIQDISYLLERADRVRGILITHGHEDHTGALPFVLSRLNVPVYAPRLAHGLIEVKLREHRILSRSTLHEITPGVPIALGAFQVEFFRVCHSIPDAMGLAIRTPAGLVVHSGDFKIDHTPVDNLPTDFTRLAEICSGGVLLLLSDSTYAEVPGYTPSERVLDDSLDRIIGAAPARVMVATFASLISRVQQVVNAAVRHNRKVAVVGRSMVNNVAMAQKMGYLRIPDGTHLPLSEIKGLPPERVVIVTTGSQGEPTSALVRIANREHRDIQVLPDDTIVVSASPIPGNEVTITRTLDALLRQGARVLHAGNAQVHVHGHASQEELKVFTRLVRPRFFVPVHGEYHHLVAHAELARGMGVPNDGVFVLEDGDILELSDHGGRVTDRIPSGHTFVSGRHLFPEDSDVLRDRQSMSRNGVVVVAIVVDRATGMLARKPEIRLHGFLAPSDVDGLWQDAAQNLMEALDQSWTLPEEDDALTRRAGDALGHFLYRRTRRRATVLPVIVSV